MFLLTAVPFAADWSPSACRGGPPRLAHALSAAAVLAQKPHAYAAGRGAGGDTDEGILFRHIF